MEQVCVSSSEPHPAQISATKNAKIGFQVSAAILKSTFFACEVEHWNRLSLDVVSVPSNKVVKKRLDAAWYLITFLCT